jgi:tetratricopeptide (TPR) repeat protein
MAERKISTTFTRYKHKISSEELQLLADKLVQNPENYDLMDWAAFAYYSHGDLDRAIEYYRKLVQWDPANASYHYYLANALFKLSDVPGAAEHWTRVMQLDKTGAFSERARRKLMNLDKA